MVPARLTRLGAVAALAAGFTLVAASPAFSATALTRALGDRTLGAFTENSQLVVTVTDEAAARQVRAAGAEPRRVPFRASELAAVTGELDRSARIPGTTWRVDPRTGQVRVTADPTVTGTALTRLTSAVDAFGAKARLERTRTPLRPLLTGGDAIWGQGLRCSLGFNVHDANGNPGFLTAGHCGVETNDWWADSGDAEHIATTQRADFPGTDYSYAAYDPGAEGPSAVNTGQEITGAADATIGEQVTRSGSTSGVHSGTVTGLDATVNYQEGSVYGLIDTDVCAEPGDSGGALFDGPAAIGLTSGGSGDCESGGETFFQPVPAALQAYGLSIP